MARLYTGGFELRDPQAEGLTRTGASGSLTFDSGKARSGTYSLKCASGLAAANYVTRALTTVSGRRYWIRTYVWMASGALTGSNLFFEAYDSGLTQYTWLEVGATGVLKLGLPNGTSQTSLNTFPRDQWVKLDLGITIDTAGNDSVDVYVNNVADPSLTTGTTGLTNSLISFVSWGNDVGTASQADIWMDDVAINDDQGTDQNGRTPSGKVVYALPTADPGTSSANWIKGTATTTARNTPLDDPPPVYETFDGTAASAEDYVHNDTSGANAALNLTMTDYTTLGVSATDAITLVQPVANTGSTSATDTAGDIGLASNPTIAQLSFTAFDNGVASSTSSTWPHQRGTVSYLPAVTRGTGPVMTIRKVTATTRVAIVNSMALVVEYLPGQGFPFGGRTQRNTLLRM